MNVDFGAGRNYPLFALLATLLIPSVRAEEGDGRVQELRLHSGAKLIGEVKNHPSDGEWELASPDIVEPVRLKPGSVRSLARLSGGAGEEDPAPATLVFVSGDRVPVEITGFDGSSFSVRLPWAESPRPVDWQELQRIIFAETGSKVVFAGPTAGQKWEFTSGSERGMVRRQGDEENAAVKEDSSRNPWKAENGVITADGPGSTSVDANLPDQVTITFDLEWTGMLSFSMGMFTDAFLPSDADEKDGPTVVAAAAKGGEVLPMREGLAVDLNQHSIILRSYSPEQGQDMLGSGQMPQELRGRTKARVTVRMDRAAGVCGIWMGDRLLRKWSDLGNLGGPGKALSFWQHHSNGTVVIRRLVVRSWNGKFEDETPAAEEERDTLVAADGTKITGKLGAMTNGQFSIETSVGPIEAGMADVRHLIRASGKDEKSEKSQPLGALLTLSAGAGEFYLDDFRVEAEGAVFLGRHAELGEISLPAAQVEFIDFQPSARDERAADSPRGAVARPPIRKIILPGQGNNAGGAPAQRRPLPLIPLNR